MTASRARWSRSVIVLVLLLCAAAPALQAQAAPPPVPAAAAGPDIDPVGATNAYLATMPAEQRARSDAYFEGLYWIALWSFVLEAAIFLLLLHTGWSARLRDGIARVVRYRSIQPAVYTFAFILVVSLLTFPLDVYTDYFREHQYGLATQGFGGWMGDVLKGLAVTLVFMPIAAVALYAVLRRAGAAWWLWGTLVTIALLAVVVSIGPVYIAPLFNTYSRLPESPIRAEILRMAHANGIAADDVYEVDASRQSTRVSANVSGMFGTERITLNDNLLKRASPAAIEAVMGHEMGHYVLNHGYKMILAFGVVIAFGFGLIQYAFGRLASRYRMRWRIDDVADPAGLPLIALLFSSYIFVLTPVVDTIVRTNEYEADVFGLNAARQPDGFAEAALLLSDYRKMSPGPVEEFIFYDHPSGRTRILTAMRWKAAQQAVPPTSVSSR